MCTGYIASNDRIILNGDLPEKADENRKKWIKLVDIRAEIRK